MLGSRTIMGLCISCSAALALIACTDVLREGVGGTATSSGVTTNATSSVGGSASASTSAGPFMPAPVAYWSFDTATVAGTTVSDAVGSHDATMMSATPGASGIVSEAVTLDGATGHLEVADDPALEPKMEGTLAVWVRFAALPSKAGHIFTLIDKGGFSTDFTLLADNADDHLVFYVASSVQVRSALPVQLAKWTHVVGTYKANDAIRLYIDGQMNGMTPIGVRSADTQPLWMGDGPYFGGRPFNGAIDESGVWSVALADADVAALFARGVEGTPIVP